VAVHTEFFRPFWTILIWIFNFHFLQTDFVWVATVVVSSSYIICSFLKGAWFDFSFSRNLHGMAFRYPMAQQVAHFSYGNG
jgi:hypothetical protein